jgi:ribonucleoside-diphosphate reductase alpha chain
MMIDTGFPVEDDQMNPQHTSVFSFPIKCYEEAVFRQDMTAIEQLELWKTYQEHWCEHKPSVTISVKEDEWMEVGAWVYKHFDLMSGVSFLPFSDHSYKQAPYQDCTELEYKKLENQIPKNVDWSLLAKYEKSDMTIGSQELACVAGGCEIQ